MSEEPPGDRSRLARSVEGALVVAASIAFAASFGFNFPLGNQAAYFLSALRLLDPTLFRRDWLLAETTDYHHAFAHVGAFLLSLDEDGWAVALAFTLVAAIGSASLYALLRICSRRLALPNFLLLLTIAFFTRTGGPALSYVFDGTLQPSTLSSGLLLIAVPLFVAERYLASGILLALSGLLHANILVLACAAFGTAHLCLGRVRLLPRLAAQFGPALIVFAMMGRMLLRGGSGGASAALGRSIYLDLRAPHHFVLDGQWGAFLPLVGWQLMALGVLAPLTRERGPYRSLGALAVGLSFVIWGGVAASAFVDQARVLFPWRLTAHTELVLQAATLSFATRLMAEPRSLAGYGRLPLAAIAAGFLVALFAHSQVSQPGAAKVLALVGIATLAGALSPRWLPRLLGREGADDWFRRWPARGPTVLTIASLFVLVTFSSATLARIPAHSSLLRPPASDSAPLLAWVRAHTAVDALLLTPPDLEAARLLGRRAIVVDWKCNPGLPSELLAWYRRLLDVTGLDVIKSVDDLSAYDRLDAGRVERLRARYGLDYAVVRRGHEGTLPYPHAYEDDRFILLRLTGKPAP